MLYDFEEYVEAENFEADKFTELQELSRKAVLRISHIVLRMKLAPPHPDHHDLESLASSIAAEPAAVMVRQPSEDVIPWRRESLPYPEDTEPPVKYAIMPYPSGPSPDLEPRRAESPSVALLRSVQEKEPAPRLPPFIDPWSHRFLDQDTVASSDSALASSNNSEYNAASPIIAGRASKPSRPSSAVPLRSPNRISTTSTTSTMGHQLEQPGGLARFGARNSISPLQPPRPPNSRGSVGSSTNASARSSVSDPRRESHLTFDMVVSPISPMNRTSGYSDFQSQGQSPHVYPLFTRLAASAPASPQNDDPEPVIFPTISIPDGLIPVEEDAVASASPLLDPEAQLGGCSINLDSSFYQFKGFCEGAMEITRGGLGIRHIKKQVSIYAGLFGQTPSWLTISCGRVSHRETSRLRNARYVPSSWSGKPLRGMSRTKVSFPWGLLTRTREIEDPEHPR